MLLAVGLEGEGNMARMVGLKSKSLFKQGIFALAVIACFIVVPASSAIIPVLPTPPA